MDTNKNKMIFWSQSDTEENKEFHREVKLIGLYKESVAQRFYSIRVIREDS